jgi:hypothetical protein
VSTPWSTLRELWHGLTRPSLGALLVTLAVPAAALTLCCLLITPELIASEAHRYFARDGTDGDLYLTARLAALARVTPVEPVVVVLGGSSMVEAFSDPEALEAVIRNNGAGEVTVWGLASWGQSLDGSLAIARRLPEHLQGVVLIGVTPFALALGPDVRPGMLVESWDFDETSIGLALTSDEGNFFWRNRAFFLPRLGYLARNLWKGPVTHAVHPFTWQKAPIGEAEWERLAPRLRRRIDDSYERNLVRCLATIEAIAAEARRRGRMEVVILESPIAPRAIEEVLGETFWREHRARLDSFARARGMQYWFLQDEAALESVDFYDLNHLFKWPAIDRHTRVLGRHAADLLRDEGIA